MQALATVAQLRALDQDTIQHLGVPGVALMEVAGAATVNALCRRLQERSIPTQGATVAIFCGAGNNGGDGHVIARHLLGRGHAPHVFLLADPSSLTHDAAINFKAIVKLGLPITHLGAAVMNDAEFERFCQTLPSQKFDVSVDAILGSGLVGPPRGRFLSLILALERMSCFKVAVDIPSGLSADTGRPLGVTSAADLTVTYGFASPGHVLYPGRDLVGELEVVDLGFNAQQKQVVGVTGVMLQRRGVVPFFSKRPRDGHKGTFGHVLVLAGSPGKTGAAILAGSAALRSGAGLVTVGTAPLCVDAIALLSWEIMAAPVLAEGCDAFNPAALLPHLNRAKVIAAGPGLGEEPGTRGVVKYLLMNFRGPLVLDADALNVVKSADLNRGTKPLIVITPHPGEMARLLGVSVREVQLDRLKCALTFARRSQVIVVLKSGSTVIAHPDGRYAINTSGTPGMGSAGMGDVLTGMIAAFIGQGLSPWEAACVGVFSHGLAGERAAQGEPGIPGLGERGLTAKGLLDALPRTLASFENNK